jgi:hypothetical protein
VAGIPAFAEYLASLGRLTAHIDPTAASPEAAEIKAAAASLAAMEGVTTETLVTWVTAHPAWVNVLGLAVGLSQEKLKNNLKHRFDTASWIKLARTRPAELVQMLEEDFDLIRLLGIQRGRPYDFGDILVARAGTRRAAAIAGASGRKIEDEIEAIASDLGLPYETRTRFVGRDNLTGPCDLVVPSGQKAEIAVAAKGNDSTGSKLSAAFDEIEKMAGVRQPRQFIMAVIDGIGWKSRQADLRRLYDLWERQQIDGMYTLATLDDFRQDLEQAARLRGLLPSDGQAPDTRVADPPGQAPR